uniref:RNA-directed DNA polymerase n=1 Tax=Tanacetum cinerariifolium TaxID=118510 RepID=A0A699ICV4_TANCI|nr:reverse transcriptase domain-containing protein [Tanacetum cinerariifolium]
MRTRSQSRHKIAEPLLIEFPSQEDQFQEDPPEVPMADNRTMAQLLQAPTEGYEDAIVILKIAANNFELKHGLINLVQNKQFFGHDKEDPHAYICLSNKITSTMRVPNVPNSTIKLMLFPFSLEGAARIWLEKEPPRSILTWDDLVSKFINQFFPPSKMANLRNEIMRFQQRFDELFSKAWDHFNDLLRACPHHGFSEMHKLDTFYNALSVNDQDSLNSAAVVAKVNSSSSTPAISSNVAELKDMVRALLLDKKNQSLAPAPSPTPAPVKAVEPNCVTCGGTLPGNTITKPKEDLKGITTRSGVAYQETTIPTPSKVAKQGTETVIAPVSASMPNLKPLIPYPSRRNNERRRDQANKQIEKFYKICKDMSFEISFTDALILMPKFASTLKALIGNKKKLSEMARTPMTEHCLAVILNKLPKKLEDPGKFLIPCELLGMDEYLVLADLGASINLMPLSVWKGLSLLELTPTCMTLELADRSVSKPIGITKDVKTVRALIDVHKGELTLRIRNEAITYNLDQTSRYSANYDQMTANKIDVTDEAFKEYSQDVLGFSDVIMSGNPTPSDDPIVSTTSPTLTPFGDSDFLLFEEADAFFAILNCEPSPPLPNHKQFVPSFKNELKACEAKTIKSSVDEPPEVELKDLPPHLKYAFLEGDNKLPVIIANELGDEEKSALIKVLKSHKRAIAWKLSDIQGINPEFCTHKIIMEEDYKPAVQNQRRVNPKIHDVNKKEVEKLLDAGLIYSIFDNPWVSPVHCVPKKGGFTVVENEKNELIPTRLVTRWRVCIDYQKLNEATRKDHFPLPFMDQMLERLAGNEYYYFLDGFFGYFQIPIDPRDQEKTMFTCPYGTFAYRRMPFGLCNAPGTFQRCMLAIFHDMVDKMMEVFMDDFSVFRNSFENCLSRLDKMLQRCEDTKLCLNWEKSHFMVKEGIVLGHKIYKNRIEVDKAKINVITKLPHPTTIKGVRSFLDHAGFYRRFIKDFSKISRPMTHLLEKDTPFIFSEDCIKAFQTLKKILMEAPILIALNWDLPFKLMCDASDFAIGAVLGQRHEKHFRPIHYASKILTEAESNYTMTEKEMLAVVYAFEKFRSYLIMNKCIVNTDHSALKYLFAKKDAKARLLRWVRLFQKFDFDVIDTKGLRT